jgi:hypothetical protein
MLQRKLRSKAHIKKFLKDNKKAIKGIERKADRTDKYAREPWMLEASLINDGYEEFLYKESDDL